MNKFLFRPFVTAIALVSCVACADNSSEKAATKSQQLLAHYEREYMPIRKEYNLQSFMAASTGKAEAYQKESELRYQTGSYFADKDRFTELKEIVEAANIEDQVLARQTVLLYYDYLEHQMNAQTLEKVAKLETGLKQKFSRFRAEINEKVYTDNDVREVMVSSRDTQELKQVWEASKLLGKTTATDIVKLVKLRNKAAHTLGFANYFDMVLYMSDQNPKEVDQIYNELDILTRGPYTQLKADIDKHLIALYGISRDELRPWHYQDVFFQRAPKVVQSNYDSLYAQADVVQLGSEFYKSMGFDVEHIVRNSDLYPKVGKNQLGFTKNIDYKGDVRILLNVKPDEYSMNLFLYEMGFALYLKNISADLPYILRRPAHFFTTDAVAALFASLSTNPVWMKHAMALNDKEAKQLHQEFLLQQRLNKFVFSRWAQVMYRFEQSMYEDPDQDLNALWWHLVENYQLIARPEGRNAPDWATKEHLVTMPARYHNYLLGELFAAQLHHHIALSVQPNLHNLDSLDFYGVEQIGKYLRSNVFEHGAKYTWQELVKKATGDELKPDYFFNKYISF